MDELYGPTEDGFPPEPPTADEMDQWEQDAHAAWDFACDERAFDVAEAARLEVLDLQLAAMANPNAEPF